VRFKRVAAGCHLGGYQGEVRVYDINSGELVHRFPEAGSTDRIAQCRCVAYSPNGKYLAAGGFNRVVHVWDLATGAEKYRLVGHQLSVSSLAFSRDGRRLASMSSVGRLMGNKPGPDQNPLNLQTDGPGKPRDVKVWDMATGREIFSRQAHGHNDRHVALSPDGEVVAVAGGDDGLVQLYDVTTGKERVVLNTRAAGVAFSPDGQLVPRAPLYLTGQVGGQPVSIHAEGERVSSPDRRGADKKSICGRPDRRSVTGCPSRSVPRAS
jgi:WD40 repeat protein